MPIFDQNQQQQVQPAIQPHLPPGPENDFFRFRIDPTDIVTELQHQLKGEVWIPSDGQKVGHWDKIYEPELNDDGISDVINIIYSVGLNKSTILGCLSHEEIYERCNKLWKKLSLYFVLNGTRVDLDKNRRDVLLLKIIYMVHSALSRSENGKEADQLSSAVQRLEHSMKEEKSSGGFNPLGFVLGRRSS